MTLGSNMTYKYEWPILITFQLFSTITLLLKSKRIHAAGVRRVIVVSWRILAAHASSAEEKQRHLLDAFSLMKRAVSLQEQVLSDVLNVLPPHEVRDVLNITSLQMFFQIGCANFGQKSAECIPAGNKWLFTLTVSQKCSVYTGNR